MPSSYNAVRSNLIIVVVRLRSKLNDENLFTSHSLHLTLVKLVSKHFARDGMGRGNNKVLNERLSGFDSKLGLGH